MKKYSSVELIRELLAVAALLAGGYYFLTLNDFETAIFLLLIALWNKI